MARLHAAASACVTLLWRAGVLALLVQHLSGSLLTEVGGVDGLLPALVELALNSGEAFAR